MAKSKKKASKSNPLWFIVAIGLFVGGVFGYQIWQDRGDPGEHDLSQIGQGENIIVQIHDPL